MFAITLTKFNCCLANCWVIGLVGLLLMADRTRNYPNDLSDMIKLTINFNCKISTVDLLLIISFCHVTYLVILYCFTNSLNSFIVKSVYNKVVSKDNVTARVIILNLHATKILNKIKMNFLSENVYFLSINLYNFQNYWN